MSTYRVMGRSGPLGRGLTLEQAEALAGVSGCEIVPEPRCLDEGRRTPCQGPVEYRHALSSTGRSFPRCDQHWNERLDEQERITSRYPDSDLPPADFDPSYAGERWDEED